MNKSRSDWNNMKIVLSTLFISLLIQPALFGAEKCALMLEDDIDPEEYSEVMGKKIEFCCGSCVQGVRQSHRLHQSCTCTCGKIH